MNKEILKEFDETTVNIVDDLIVYLQKKLRNTIKQIHELSDYQTELNERIESLRTLKEELLDILSKKNENLQLIVRCEDCKIWRRNPANSAYGDCGKRVTKKNDYCSYGVRKE